MRREEPGAEFRVEIASVDRLREEILPLCMQGLPGFSLNHYTKYYEDNPLGSPQVATARRSSDGSMIGAAALHPHLVTCEGQTHVAAVAGDFVVAAGYRGYGPAVAMQRQLLASLGALGWSAAYGLPNRAAAAVFARVGYRTLGPSARFVRPLGRDALVALRPRANADLRAFLRARRPLVRRRALHGYTIEAAEVFDDRFQELWQTAERRGLCGPKRTLALMNWKYETHRPSSDGFSILTVATGDVAAYSVSYTEKSVRHLADLVWRDERSLQAIVAAELTRAHDESSSAVDLLNLGTAPNELSSVLTAFGFSVRADVPPMVFLPDGSTAPGAQREWSLFEGAVDL